MKAVVYKIDSGQITKNISCPEEMVSLQYNNETEDYLEHESVDDASFYVANGTIEPRPQFEEVVSGTVISGLPNPTTVIAAGTVVVVSDGQADLTFSQVGTYAVQLQSFPYVDKVVEVTQL